MARVHLQTPLLWLLRAKTRLSTDVGQVVDLASHLGEAAYNPAPFENLPAFAPRERNLKTYSKTENKAMDGKEARFAGVGSSARIDRRFFLLAGLMVSFLVGCSSPPGAQPSSVPAPAPGVTISPGSQVSSALAADEHLIGITSEPSGARVLVNNRLIGRAPLELKVKVTSHGFCADYVTVKARFVSDDTAHTSQTVEAELTPREKAPARMNFTPEGVQWRLK